MMFEIKRRKTTEESQKNKLGGRNVIKTTESIKSVRRASGRKRRSYIGTDRHKEKRA